MLEQIAVSVVRDIMGENLNNGNDLVTHDCLKEHFSESYEERVTGSRSSNKTYMQKAINDLVEKEGDLIEVNEGERYICPLDHDELLESIENELNKHVGLTDIDLETISTQAEDIYSVNIAATDPQTHDDNDDDDLDFDDDDDLDSGEVIKFRKMMYDESESSDFEKKEVVDTDKIIVELDKLLKEVIEERGVTSTREPTRFIERDFIFVDEIESKCEYLILKIVASDIKQDRQGAINVAQAVLDKAKIKASENSEDTIVTICEHVVEEFNDCSDEDYSKLKTDVWG